MRAYFSPEEYLTKFNTGRLRPDVQPLTLLYHFGRKGTPFIYLLRSFTEERCPFHIPTLGIIVLIFMKCLINKLIQLKGASIRNIIIKGPFKIIPKWPISLPFYVPQLVKSLPFYIPEAWKRYPFRAEPPRIGQYREYSPPGISVIV